MNISSVPSMLSEVKDTTEDEVLKTSRLTGSNMLLSQHSEKGDLTISTNERGLNLLNSIGSIQIIFSVPVHLEHSESTI